MNAMFNAIKAEYFNSIEGFPIREKIIKENVLIYVIQVDSCPLIHSLSLGWT